MIAVADICPGPLSSDQARAIAAVESDKMVCVVLARSVPAVKDLRYLVEGKEFRIKDPLVLA